MSRLKDAIKALHARKDRAYEGAWKRRGERISIVPNIARKVDRIIAFAAGASEMVDESVLDTAIDLNVYCLKYLLFLAEEDSSLLGKLPLIAPAWPLSDREENFDQFVDAIGYENAGDMPLKSLLVHISDLFEELWPAVEAGSCAAKRFALADALCQASAQLIARLWLDRAGLVEKFIQSEFELMSKEPRS